MIHVVNDNPNPHGTTLCGTEDCHGPYVVFSAFELDDVMNPHPVICAHHLETDIVPLVEKWEAENYIDAEFVEVEPVSPDSPGVREREEEPLRI